jgi:PilZ domain
VRSKSRPRKTVKWIRTPPVPISGVCPYRFRVATTYRIPTLTSRREFFRLPYPVTSGATLTVGGTNYTVAEVSERGLRLSCSVDKFPLEQRVQGTLKLTAGMRCTITGTVLRIEDRCVILMLSRGPTSYDVLREQQHLSDNFPDWKPQPI